MTLSDRWVMPSRNCGMREAGSGGAQEVEAGGDCRQLAAAIHLDLDGATHVYRAHGWTYPGREDGLFQTGLPKALECFERAGIRATLFVIAEDLEDSHKRELIQSAVRRGHEIASHSVTHRKLTSLCREEKRREIFESRQQISEALGVEVQGFRAPGFAMDPESLDLLGEAGYTYDSSLFQSNGLARTRPVPSRPLIELPLPSHAPLPWPFHPCYSLVLGTWYFRTGLQRFRQTRRPLVLLFHLTDFADPEPGHYLRGWASRFYTLSHISGEQKRDACEEMLALVGEHYRIVETRELIHEGCHSESRKR